MLVKCRTCNSEVDSDAQRCPKCGAERPDAANHTTYIVLVIVAVFCYAVWSFFG